MGKENDVHIAPAVVVDGHVNLGRDTLSDTIGVVIPGVTVQPEKGNDDDKAEKEKRD